jgi:endonuclease G
MSKITLGLVAAASAATGAACTALFYSTASKKAAQPHQPVPVAVTSKVSPPASTLARSVPSLVDPAGLFQYGMRSASSFPWLCSLPVLSGFPGPVNDLATRQALISSYDRRTRNPSWVVEHITAESLALKGGDRGHSQFVEDEAST